MLVLFALVLATAAAGLGLLLNRARVLRTSLWLREYQFDAVDLDSADLGADKADLVRHFRHTLPSWKLQASFRVSDSVCPVYTFWVDESRPGHLTATLSAIQGKDDPPRTGCLLQFTTDLEDGGTLVTCNDLVESGRALRDDVHLVVIPGTLNPTELLEVHDAVYRRFGRQAAPAAPKEWAEWLREQFRTYFERQLRGGILEPAGQAELRLTWKGAMLAAIAGFSPVQAVQTLRVRRKARRLLRQLELPEAYACGCRLPDDFRASPPEAPVMPAEPVVPVCPVCQYNLTGAVSEVCPECGSGCDLEALRRAYDQGLTPVNLSRAVNRLSVGSLLGLAAGLVPAIALTWLFAGSRPGAVSGSDAPVVLTLLWLVAWLSILFQHGQSACQQAAMNVLAYQEVTKDENRRSVGDLTRFLLRGQILLVVVVVLALCFGFFVRMQ